MRCHVCNSILPTVIINDDDGSIEPCTKCMEVVKDTLEGYEPSEKPVSVLDDAVWDVYKYNF
jgi:hypothetical protein